MSTHAHSLAGAAALTTVLMLGALSGCGKTDTPATLLAEAKQFQQQGDHVSALIQLKNAVAKNPTDPEARLALGETYNKLGDAVSAEKEVRKAMELGMAPERTLPELLLAQLFQGQFQKVIDATADKAYTADVKVVSQRGAAFYQLGKRAEAAEAFERALKLDPGYPVALMGLANIAMANEDKAAAARYVDLAVTNNPKDIQSWLFKGDFERAQGNPAAALAAYDQVLALDPDSASGHLQKAYLLIAERRYDEAAVSLAAARKNAPKNLMVSYASAMLDFTRGKHAAALDSLQHVLRVAPDHMPSVLLAGAVQFTLKSLPQAEQHLKKYHEAHPESDYARKLLASTRIAAGDPKGAIAVLAPVVGASQDAQLLAIAGKAYTDHREFGKATELLERASALDPKKAQLRTALGLSKLEQGEEARALSELELASTLDQTTSHAGTTLAMTALRLNQFDKALAALAPLEARAPGDPMIQNLKGLALLGKKDQAAARAAFEKALSLHPDFFPAVDNLARLDMQAKNLDATRQRYEAFLAKYPNNVDALTALGAMAVAQHRLAEAGTLLERAGAVDPAAVGPAIVLAGHYVRMGAADKALILMRKLLVANPDNPAVLDQLGQLQVATGDNGSAMETFTKLTVAAPQSAEAHFRLGSAHAAMNNLPSASASLKRALVLQPNYLDAQLALASAHLRQQQFNDALGVARSMQKQHPKLPVGYVSEADVLLVQRNAMAAIPLYDKAFSLGNNAELLIKLYEALRIVGKTKEADARVQQWRAANPDDVKVPGYLGEQYIANKKYQLAITEFEAILKKAPAYPSALNNLAVAYELAGDARALPTAELAFKALPGSAAVSDTLGWLLVQKGDLARGLPLLRDASARLPGVPEIRLHLAKALIQARDKDAARKELDVLVEKHKQFPQGEEARGLLKQL
ncbi:XrtA/PEP-CTERM system TPR-repeat protein PrsT [Massilia scottii]|uniref:XrtA/PEP-CTERM system TPR-repeat protein PrsT n=1 Tax=Massilia scottii TaxID=3057166 RepID=UPI0027965267|nr:XrtA/PEP-CTERM system TPR-repeat protein PrsT [Massilia sp. CCM 9029]MDQ1830125.1 PEP-CTERM system TPR-repeat protein PrsT [Massilia sp. CCM 9029]